MKKIAESVTAIVPGEIEFQVPSPEKRSSSDTGETSPAEIVIAAAAADESFQRAQAGEPKGDRSQPFGVKLSELAAPRDDIKGKLYLEILRLFREWANVDTGPNGVTLPTLDSVRKAIFLGQTFVWRRTGVPYRLVVARDHLAYSDAGYDKIDYIVFIYAEVNYAKTGRNVKDYEAARETALEFGDLVDRFLVRAGVAEELKAYEFRLGSNG